VMAMVVDVEEEEVMKVRVVVVDGSSGDEE
jgi:hypothetical protein